jgi:hypothetical protein
VTVDGETLDCLYLKVVRAGEREGIRGEGERGWGR